MYHPLVVCSAHVPCLSLLSNICTAHPNGASGILLYSKFPWTYWYAEMVGASLDCQGKFKVSIDYGSSLAQIRIRNVSSNPTRITLKWFLNVCITRSAKFSLWLSGGTSWIVQFFFISAFSSADASLSIKCVVGLIAPVAVRQFHSAM